MLRTWHIGRLHELEKNEKKTVSPDGEQQEYISRFYEGTIHGTHDHTIKISVDEDGSMSFSSVDGEGFIYLYREQVKHLETILTERKKYIGNI